MAPQRFTGVYPGIVIDNLDPSHAGRLLVSVPSVPANKQPCWALPSSPLAAGAKTPTVNSEVRIEYEEGNPHYPTWLSSNPAAGPGTLPGRMPIRWLHSGDQFSRLRRTPSSPAYLFVRL
jgi:hypothetical protein